MTEEHDEDTVIDAEFTKKTEEKPPEKPGLISRYVAFVQKNQKAEAERRKRTGEPSFSEELFSFGSEWSKNISKGMANVGREEEAKLNGKTKSTKIVNDDDDFADEILFGTKKKPKQPPAGGGNGGSRIHPGTYTDEQFIEKLCEFLRYVAEDDEVELYQYRGKQLTKVDYKYLSKLLTRYLGYKVTLKERDLSFK